MVGKKQKMAPMWKKVMKLVDLDESILFFDHEHLRCAQRDCTPSEDIVKNQYREVFESRICATAAENLPGEVSPHARPRGPTTCMEGHAKKCVERYCELAKTRQQLHTVSTPCLGDHNFKKDELDTVGELSDVRSLELVDLTLFGP